MSEFFHTLKIMMLTYNANPGLVSLDIRADLKRNSTQTKGLIR